MQIAALSAPPNKRPATLLLRGHDPKPTHFAACWHALPIIMICVCLNRIGMIETSGQFLLNEVGVVINHVPDARERLAGNSIFWRRKL